MTFTKFMKLCDHDKPVWQHFHLPSKILHAHSSIPFEKSDAFPVAQMVKNLLAMQETWVQSPGQEDPLAKGMVTHSSVLAWRIPWTEEPGGLQSMGSQRVRQD